MGGSQRLRVAVIYGGRSGEHEVSLVSAASVMRQLDSTRFEVLAVSIDKRGRWHLESSVAVRDTAKPGAPAPVTETAPTVFLLPYPSSNCAVLQDETGKKIAVDVLFPVLHGSFGEDGAIQGLFELSDAPYVGSGVLGSACGMDKEFTKKLAQHAGVPVVPYRVVRVHEWASQRDAILREIDDDLGWPVFVKPANLGSSVGIHKVKTASDLDAALKDAFLYDTKVLVEAFISAREIELSVLEQKEPGKKPIVSVAGEIIPQHEFYSYEAKYIDAEGAKLQIPAALTSAQMEEAQALALKTFEAVGCEGMTRVDLFLNRETGELVLNEVNTIPGFTPISMYPKMLEASGIGYRELLSHLVDLAVIRAGRKRALKRDWKA
jgi:D-alanine-D-alanine ligase